MEIAYIAAEVGIFLQMGFYIFQDWKESKKYRQQHLKLLQQKQSTTQSILENKIRNNHDNHWKQINESEILFENMMMIGRLQSNDTFKPVDQKYKFKNLLYSKLKIQDKNILYQFLIDKHTKIAGNLVLCDGDKQMAVNLKQNIDIDEYLIDFINRKKLKYKLAPFNLFSIDYNYIEKGITAGGVVPLFGDVIYDFKDKIFRMENVKYIGYKNKQLAQILELQITAQEVQIILMSFCFVFVGWALFQDLWQWIVNWKKKKQNYQLKDVNQIYMIFGDKVKANCEVCKINLKSTFYLPCLHSVICEQCSQRNQRNKFYEDSKQVEQCQICDKKINEVIHIYNV